MNEARIKDIEQKIEQLRRALNNPNLAASQKDCPENQAALKRIGKHQEQIESLRSQT